MRYKAIIRNEKKKTILESDYLYAIMNFVKDVPFDKLEITSDGSKENAETTHGGKAPW